LQVDLPLQLEESESRQSKRKSELPKSKSFKTTSFIDAAKPSQSKLSQNLTKQVENEKVAQTISRAKSLSKAAISETNESAGNKTPGDKRDMSKVQSKINCWQYQANQKVVTENLPLQKPISTPVKEGFDSSSVSDGQSIKPNKSRSPRRSSSIQNVDLSSKNLKHSSTVPNTGNSTHRRKQADR
jgi:hypothetical protein